MEVGHKLSKRGRRMGSFEFLWRSKGLTIVVKDGMLERINASKVFYGSKTDAESYGKEKKRSVRYKCFRKALKRMFWI